MPFHISQYFAEISYGELGGGPVASRYGVLKRLKLGRIEEARFLCIRKNLLRALLTTKFSARSFTSRVADLRRLVRFNSLSAKNIEFFLEVLDLIDLIL